MTARELALQWDATDSRLMAGLGVALLGMTAIAGLLRWRGRSEKGRKIAHDFGARTLGWWIVVFAFMPAVLAGGAAVPAVFGLAALIAWREFSRVTTVPFAGRDAAWVVPLVSAHFLAVAGVLPGPGWWPALATLAMIVVVTPAVDGATRAARIGWRALGFFYAVVLVSAAPLIVQRGGERTLFFVMIVVQSGDVLQYLCGKLWGRRQLAPWLSPNKTWEGLIGGLAGTALLGAAMAPVIDARWAVGLAWGLGLGLAGTAGGLAMSAVKRRWGAKDFGTLLPGHGGLMDRFDSLSAALAVTYFWLSV